jgi:flagellar motor component MotA
MEVFGSFVPRKNPAAVYSYAISIAALIPVVGLALGPVAVVLGIVGLIKSRRRPEVLGTNFAAAGISLGTLNSLFNAAGVWCVGRGLGWW